MSLQGNLQRLGITINGTDGQFKADGPIVSETTVTTITTAGNATYTNVEIMGGSIVRDPNGADRTDQMPTAANIVSRIDSPTVGSSYEFVVWNAADGDETITISGGSGVTINGLKLIRRGQKITYRVVVTSTTSGAETVTMYADNIYDGLFYAYASIADVSTAGSYYIVIPETCKLRKASTVINGAIATADDTISFSSSVGTITETITIAFSGSAAGDIDSTVFADAAEVVVGAETTIEIATNGLSTNTISALVTLELERA